MFQISALAAHYALARLTNGLPEIASSGGYADLADQSHAGGPFVAHFRRTRRLPPRASRTTNGNGVQSMKDMTATSANIGKARQSSDEHTALHLCYRQIGISAVAAAARYNGEAKIPALARVAAGANDKAPAVY
jgi:hypothetical protein